MSNSIQRWFLLFTIALAIISQNFVPDGLFFNELKDFFHYIVFTLAAFFLFLELENRFEINRILVVTVILILTVFGGAIEIIQPYFQSDQSWGDFFYDIAGAISGYLVFAITRKPHQAFKRLLLLNTIIVLAAVPLIAGARCLWLQKQQMPILMDFEIPVLFSQLHWNNQTHNSIQFAPPEWDQKSNHVGVLFLQGEGWANLGLKDFPADWQSFQYLSFDIFSPIAEPIAINLRIIDAQHNWEYDDRFNKHIPLQPGLNHLTIPLSDIENGPKARKLNLDEIKEILFFGSPRADKAKLYIDDIRLGV